MLERKIPHHLPAFGGNPENPNYSQLADIDASNYCQMCEAEHLLLGSEYPLKTHCNFAKYVADDYDYYRMKQICTTPYV